MNVTIQAFTRIIGSIHPTGILFANQFNFRVVDLNYRRYERKRQRQKGERKSGWFADICVTVINVLACVHVYSSMLIYTYGK